MFIEDKKDKVFIPQTQNTITANDYNQIKNEIQNAIELAGMTPEKDVIQFPQALKTLTQQSGAEEIAKIKAAGQEQLDAVNTTGAQAVQSAQTAAGTATTKAQEAIEAAASAASYSSTASSAADNASLSAENAAQSASSAASAASQSAQSAASIEGDAEAAAASASAAAQSAQAAASSASLADIQNKITNCLTKIPQDINLVLSEGTLTLKAGSKVYKGDGTAVSINSDTDLSVQTGFYNKQGLVFYNPTSDDFCPLERCFSGATAPTVTGNTNFWYDTAEKIVKYTNNQGQTWNDFSISLPLAVVTVGSNGTVTSIDQVFNGFGYIGSTIFVLPGVEGLYPNGRNADGTLNNIAFTVSNLKTCTYTTTSAGKRSMYLRSNDFSDVANDRIYYDASVNKNVYSTNGTTASYAMVGSLERGTAGLITSFSPQTAFHAVDYNDLAKVDGLAQQTDSLVQNDRIGFPNLSAKVSINSGYTAPSNGWVLIISSNSNANTEMKFDNAQVYFQGAAGSAASAACGFIPIKKGQVVTITGEVSVKQFMPSL